MRMMVFGWTRGGAGRHSRSMFAFAALLAGFAAPASAGGISAVDLSADAIILRFDAPMTEASAFLLDAPQRIAIDLRGTLTGGVPAAPGGPITAARMARRDGGDSRVVFDLATPAVVTGGGFAADGRTLRLAIAPADAAGFRHAARARRQSFVVPAAFHAAPQTSANRATVTIPLDAPQPLDVARVPVRGDAGRPLVVLDPGHGGHDPGSLSIWEGRKEKDVALQIARAIRDELLASGRVRVAMTRNDDRFVVLGERRELARRLHADLFISIHADSAPNSDTARGATVYTLSEVASDKVAAQLAARENRADILNGVNLGRETSDVSSILVDLTQRETMNVSSAFAALLQREMSPLVTFKTSFHRFASLVVLKAPDVPSVLLETGYMSNLDDSKALFSRDGQHAIAVGVRRAVIAHFARRLAER